jgi:hypothetical protein
MIFIGKLMDLIPTWILLVAILGLAAFVGLESVRLAHAREAVAESRTELANYKTSVAETTRLLQASNDRHHIADLNRVQESLNAASLREQNAIADSAGLQRSLDGLRHALRLATRGDPVPGSSGAASPASPDSKDQLLLDCAIGYVGMAEAADGHASDVVELTDAWPRIEPALSDAAPQ